MVAKSWRDVRAPLSWVDSESGWGSVNRSARLAKKKRIDERVQTRMHVQRALGRKKNYQVYFVNVLRYASPFEVAVGVVR